MVTIRGGRQRLHRTGLLQSKPPHSSCSTSMPRCGWSVRCSNTIKIDHPDTQVIILTAHDSLNNAIDSIKRGAYSFYQQAYAPEELLSLVEKALEKQALLRENDRDTPNGTTFEAAPGASGRRACAGFQEHGDAANRRSDYGNGPSEANVLITGESGVGKE